MRLDFTSSMSENNRHTGGKMHIQELYHLANREEIDYIFLMDALKNYTRPREKISVWLKEQSLIRVKKGLYVFGKKVSQKTYSLEVLANLIYGPSAISMQYALSFYGMIPERVSVITSITNKRNKYFQTPVGHFTYRYLHPKFYSESIELKTTSSGLPYLIASPEKAFCDLIYLERPIELIKKEQEIEIYLSQDLRIDIDQLKQLNMKNLLTLTQQYRQGQLSYVVDFLAKR